MDEEATGSPFSMAVSRSQRRNRVAPFRAGHSRHSGKRRKKESVLNHVCKNYTRKFPPRFHRQPLRASREQYYNLLLNRFAFHSLEHPFGIRRTIAAQNPAMCKQLAPNRTFLPRAVLGGKALKLWVLERISYQSCNEGPIDLKQP